MHGGKHSGSWWVATAVVTVLIGAGVYWLVSFLIGLSLSDADQWMGVLSGLVAVLVAGGSVVLALSRRASASNSGEDAVGSTFNVTSGRDSYTAHQMNFHNASHPDEETPPR